MRPGDRVTEPDGVIQLDGIRKRFGATLVLDEVSLAVARGECVALLGASGSGKTTLLRVIAGLEQPDAGQVRLDGRDVTALGAGKRGVGFVFQGYALFQHMTVADNIAFGLRVRGVGRVARAAAVSRLLAMVRLEGLERRLPSQLSGGQRQRVALARALAPEPRILLLDEPFGALDRPVREALRESLRVIQRGLGITAVFVTHDHEEAEALADRLVVMEAGRMV